MANLRKTLCEQILRRFPQNFRYAFAYGSGALQQASVKDVRQNMIDLMLVVDNPMQWHKLNFQKNRSDYSLIRSFGSRKISQLQEHYGAKVYFNTLVPVDEHIIKYGVVSSAALTSDLLDWDSLYVAGRLHKPVLSLVQDTGPELKASLRTNLASAVHAALLTLPEQFSEQQLYERIAALSYTGDMRLALGAEDPDKVTNIVSAQIDQFRALYAPLLEAEEHVHWARNSQRLEQQAEPRYRLHHLSLLPCAVQIQLVSLAGERARYTDVEELLYQLASDPNCPQRVNQAISAIVKRSSWSQTAKNVLSAGLLKSFRYSFAKLHKSLSRRLGRPLT